MDRSTEKNWKPCANKKTKREIRNTKFDTSEGSTIFDFRASTANSEHNSVYFMIRTKPKTTSAAELDAGRPAGSGEEWLGRNRRSKRRLWERLNPLSRKQIRIVAEALALQQTHAQLSDPLRARLSATIQELDRLVTRIRALLVEVARRTPPSA